MTGRALLLLHISIAWTRIVIKNIITRRNLNVNSFWAYVNALAMTNSARAVWCNKFRMHLAERGPPPQFNTLDGKRFINRLYYVKPEQFPHTMLAPKKKGRIAVMWSVYDSFRLVHYAFRGTRWKLSWVCCFTSRDSTHSNIVRASRRTDRQKAPSKVKAASHGFFLLFGFMLRFRCK